MNGLHGQSSSDAASWQTGWVFSSFYLDGITAGEPPSEWTGVLVTYEDVEDASDVAALEARFGGGELADVSSYGAYRARRLEEAR